VESIDISVLPRWGKIVSMDSNEGDPEVVSIQQHKSIKFQIDAEINEKIVLWQGDIRLLDVDVIVNSTNETMIDNTGISGSILDAAGPELLEEISRTEQCKTGESRITRGYLLPARWVIHTVGPRYNEKYKTAAENALHNCYRSSLELLKENSLRTIAFPLINSQKRGYPPEPGCHIAVRTLRRFLEHWGKDIDLIILCVPSNIDFALYNRVLPLYFPRCKQDLLLEKEELPRDVGNEFGETVIEERKIRISAFPGNALNGSTLDAPFISPSEPIQTSPRIISLNEHLPNQFAMMKADFDEERKKKLDSLSKEEKTKLEAQQIYYDHLSKARTSDLSDVARINVIYESGKDIMGRPVIVIVGSRLPNERPQLERVFLYMLKIMDRIAEHHYTVVYLHTHMNDRETPEFSWMKKIYNIIDPKYGNNLQNFYIVHSTFWLKIFETVVSAFITSSFWSKVVYIEKLIDLYNNIDPNQIVLPPEVVNYDISINGRPIMARKAFQTEVIEAMVNDL